MWQLAPLTQSESRCPGDRRLESVAPHLPLLVSVSCSYTGVVTRHADSWHVTAWQWGWCGGWWCGLEWRLFLAASNSCPPAVCGGWRDHWTLDHWPELLRYLLSVITTAGGTTTDGTTDGDRHIILCSRIVNLLVALLLFLYQGYLQYITLTTNLENPFKVPDPNSIWAVKHLFDDFIRNSPETSSSQCQFGIINAFNNFPSFRPFIQKPSRIVDYKATVKKSLENSSMLLSPYVGCCCWLRSQEGSRQQPGRIKVLASFEMSSLLEGSFPSCSLVVWSCSLVVVVVTFSLLWCLNDSYEESWAEQQTSAHDQCSARSWWLVIVRRTGDRGRRCVC